MTKTQFEQTLEMTRDAFSLAAMAAHTNNPAYKGAVRRRMRALFAKRIKFYSVDVFPLKEMQTERFYVVDVPKRKGSKETEQKSVYVLSKERKKLELLIL